MVRTVLLLARTWIQPLAGELRCHKPCSVAKKKKKKKPTTITAPCHPFTNPVILAKIKGLAVGRLKKCPLTRAIHLLVHGT